HHHVADEGDVSVGGALLLKPGQAEAMRFESGYYVVETVAVYVVDCDGGTAGGDASRPVEGLRMILPWLVASAGGGLLPPASRTYDVETSIAVDVAHSDSVCRP